MIKAKFKYIEKKNLVVIFLVLSSIVFWIFYREERYSLIEKIYKPKEIYVKLQGKSVGSQVYSLPLGCTYLDLISLVRKSQNLELEAIPLDWELVNGQVVQINR